MITYTCVLLPFTTYEDVLGYEPESSLFFDIETTGLSPAASFVFLIGAVYYSDHQWFLCQWLAETPTDESDLLQSFFSLAKAFDTLIHFNGSSFDLPFLAKRAARHHIECPLSDKKSLDLYQIFRFTKKLFQLKKSTQNTLEILSGWQREDRLTGKQMISLYQKLIGSGEPSLQKLLLLHNHDDLLGMTKLLGLSSYLALRSGNLRFTKYECDLSCLTITFYFALSYPIPKPVCISNENTLPDLELILTACQSQGSVKISLIQDELKYFFPDYKNYYYLPCEDQAVHKSVGSFIEKEYRKAAVPATCYIKKTGCFLPQPVPLIAPAFRHSYEESLSYFEMTDSFLKDTDTCSKYLSSLASALLNQTVF